MTTDRFSLTELPGELKRQGFTVLPYRAIYQKVIDGYLPELIERENSRWYARRSQVPAIAKALGLPPLENAA